MNKSIANFLNKIGLYKPVVNFKLKCTDTIQRKKFHKYGLETLIQADKAFRSVDEKMILAFGTLLGAYRDHNFISYDSDLDVEALSSSADKIREAMTRNEFQLIKQFYWEDIITEETYLYKGCHIDIFYLFNRDDKTTITYVARSPQGMRWQDANKTTGLPCVIWPCEKCEFIEIDFLGHQFYIPEKADEWLRGIYGEDYMTPIPKWTEKGRITRMEHSDKKMFYREF